MRVIAPTVSNDESPENLSPQLDLSSGQLQQDQAQPRSLISPNNSTTSPARPILRTTQILENRQQQQQQNNDDNCGVSSSFVDYNSNSSVERRVVNSDERQDSSHGDQIMTGAQVIDDQMTMLSDYQNILEYNNSGQSTQVYREGLNIRPNTPTQTTDTHNQQQKNIMSGQPLYKLQSQQTKVVLNSGDSSSNPESQLNLRANPF